MSISPTTCQHKRALFRAPARDWSLHTPPWPPPKACPFFSGHGFPTRKQKLHSKSHHSNAELLLVGKTGGEHTVFGFFRKSLSHCFFLTSDKCRAVLTQLLPLLQPLSSQEYKRTNCLLPQSRPPNWIKRNLRKARFQQSLLGFLHICFVPQTGAYLTPSADAWAIPIFNSLCGGRDRSVKSVLSSTPEKRPSRLLVHRMGNES